MVLKAIIIHCSLHIKEDRTINSIYYLLTGKRSIQTVQDAHLYGLDRFYGIYRKLSKSYFDEVINELVSQHFLTSSEQSTTIYQPTAQGKEWLSKNRVDLPFTSFNGLKYHAIDHVFIERLLLLIQVLTNSKMRNSSYIPVIDKTSTTNWVKSIYKKMRPNVNEQLQTIHDELHRLLGNFPDSRSSMFVDRLTGFKDYGMSIHQLADLYKIDVHDIKLELVGMTHQILDMISVENKHFPMMSLLISDLPINGFITLSANQTYEYIKKKHSIEEIAQMRHLKVNTVYDHIVEIALHDPSFQIHSYVSIKSQQEIMNAVQQTKSSKLKHIKDQINDETSYFQIRLTLATMSNSQKTGDINETTS